MYGSLAMVKNAQSGSYDLVISYARNGAEYGQDFLSPAGVRDTAADLRRYVSSKDEAARIRTVKVMVGGTLIASMPFAMMANFAPDESEREDSRLSGTAEP